MRMPGMISVMKSLRARLSGSWSTLSVAVPRTVMLGTKTQPPRPCEPGSPLAAVASAFAGGGAGALYGASVSCADAAPATPNARSPAIRIARAARPSVAIAIAISVAIAVARSRRVRAGLVQHHQPDRTRLDRRERLLDGALLRLLGFDHDDDLAHLRRKDARFGGHEERRRVEHDDAIGVAFRHLVEQRAHRRAREELGRARMRVAARQDRELLDVGPVVDEEVEKSPRLRPAEELRQRRTRHVGVDEEHGVVELHCDAHREVE